MAYLKKLIFQSESKMYVVTSMMLVVKVFTESLHGKKITEKSTEPKIVLT